MADAREAVVKDTSNMVNADGDPATVLEQAEVEALRVAKAYVQDGSDYKADLITGPDFFCALFELFEADD